MFIKKNIQETEMKKNNNNNNYDSNNKFSTNVFSPTNIFSPPNQGNFFLILVPSQNDSRNIEMNNNNLNKTREEKLNIGFVFPHNNLKESFQT